MSRAKKYRNALLSGYLTTITNVGYTAISIPLALHFLDKELFGLWVLVTQVGGFLMLIDFGMSSSVARFLADSKDNVESDIYASTLNTGHFVFAIQGLIALVIGITLAFAAPNFLSIPKPLEGTFICIMVGQAFLSAASLASKGISSPLWCHQRIDITNISVSASFVVSVPVLFLCFISGLGIYSYLATSVIALTIATIIPWKACTKLGFYPQKCRKSSINKELAFEIGLFAKDLSIMSFGSQLASASQVIIITRALGLESASTWALMTKPFAMAQQCVFKIFDLSTGALTEMVTRNEQQTLIRRYFDIFDLSAFFALVIGSLIALFNTEIVELWTKSDFHWSSTNNFLLATILVVSSCTRCFIGLSGITKDLRWIKYAYLFEGVCFILISGTLIITLGFTGILVASIACNAIIIGLASVIYVARHFRSTTFATLKTVFRPAFCTIMIFLCLNVISIFDIQTHHVQILAKLLVFLFILLPTFCLLTFPRSLFQRFKVHLKILA